MAVVRQTFAVRYHAGFGGKAIEFPLPDEAGRAKLTKLYVCGLEMSENLLELIVSRTKGVSAAFIKELMRHCAQFQLEFSQGHIPLPYRP